VGAGVRTAAARVATKGDRFSCCFAASCRRCCFLCFVFFEFTEPMTPGLISRFDSWTAWRTTRRGRGCGCRRRRGGSCPAWRRHRSTEVSALLPHFAPTSISRLVVQILVRSSDFVHLALQARWCRGGTCSYTPMEDSTRCALG